MLKTVNGGTTVNQTFSSTSYSTGDRFNIRFRLDTTGIDIWFNDEAVDTYTTGDSATSWGAGALNAVKLGQRPDSSLTVNEFVTVESLTIYNTAKSDAFLEALE